MLSNTPRLIQQSTATAGFTIYCISMT